MRWLGYVGLLLLVLRVVAGCALFERAKVAGDTVAYERSLDGCLVEARKTRSLAYYDACAREMDIKYGMTDGGAR